MVRPTSGITKDTPGNLYLGAGTVHDGLSYTPGADGEEGSWNFAESILGATQGGNTLAIEPEFFDPEIDGKYVATKGLKIKIGETATLTANLAEVTPENITRIVIGQDGESDAPGYRVLESSPVVDPGHYIENFAYVGQTMNGRPIIVIFDWALCTNGLNLEGQNTENSTVEAVFECHADVTQADLRKLPYKIYFPDGEAPEPGTEGAAVSSLSDLTQDESEDF